MEIAEFKNEKADISQANLKATPHNLWAITAFFDPTGGQQRLGNYRIFRERLAKQGVPLLAVECAFGRRPFQLTVADADILVQVHSRSFLWQKERLLNIALTHLPAACRVVAWLDSDVVFVKDDWAAAAAELLSDHYSHNVIQLFSEACFLEEGETPERVVTERREKMITQESFVAYYCRERRRVLNYSKAGGLAWAAKREILESVGFYDRAIVGGADWVMIGAFLGLSDFNQASKAWSRQAASFVAGKISYLPGAIFHLFHGSRERRLYQDRERILKDREFNPAWDLCLNSDGCWEWADDVPRALRCEVRDYFRLRNKKAGIFSTIRFRLLQIMRGRSLRFYFFHIWPHRFCGLAGKALRRFFPRLYYFLKGQ
jgi:hypothetical protein